jgi:hypothetical protein
MARSEDFFKDVNFAAPWGEEDWRRFFDAQEKLRRSLFVHRPRALPSADPDLAFRKVLRDFHIDPDNPGMDFSTLEAAPSAPTLLRYWEEGAEVESLPLYGQALVFLTEVNGVFHRRFPGIARRTYKSPSLRLLQQLVDRLPHHAAQIPRRLSAAHGMGYGPEGVVGNIVRCREALSHAETCLGMMTRFPQRRLPLAEYRRLLSMALRLRNDMMDWIASLRGRFAPMGK